MPDHPFDKDYFHGGGKFGGYAGSGYRDFPVHWNTFEYVKRLAPFSVLELGCGRGYVLKRLHDYLDIPVCGLEISEHCRLTRAIRGVVTRDITEAFAIAGHFDLCLSVAVLEHIPEDRLPFVFEQMAARTDRGIHGIDVHDDDGFDKTHVTMRPLSWWQERMPPGHVAVDKEDLERGDWRVNLPAELASPKTLKLNLGSFTHMFHGWTNIDQVPLQPFARNEGYRFIQWNLADPLPYVDGVVSKIFCSHVLEHFTYSDGLNILKDWRRVLAPGGVIRLAVPSLYRLTRMYTDGNLDDLNEVCGFEAEKMSDAQRFYELLIGGDHRSAYDASTLYDALQQAGFHNIKQCTFNRGRDPALLRETIDQYPELSLFMEATV